MFLVVLISLVIYIVGIVMIHHSTYNFDRDKKIKFIVISVIVTIIITLFIANISSAKIDTNMKQQLNTTKIVMVLLFSPINLIIAAPYIGSMLNKYQAEKTIENLNRKLAIFIIIIIILMILEANYINSFQAGLLQKIMK